MCGLLGGLLLCTFIYIVILVGVMVENQAFLYLHERFFSVLFVIILVAGPIVGCLLEAESSEKYVNRKFRKKQILEVAIDTETSSEVWQRLIMEADVFNGDLKTKKDSYVHWSSFNKDKRLLDLTPIDVEKAIADKKTENDFGGIK